MKLRDRLILWLAPKSDLVILTKENADTQFNAVQSTGWHKGYLDGYNAALADKTQKRDERGRFIK